ncbi:Alpha-L-rhamnosidase N-terminal domain-containing protein [Porphyromonadaceae bacterium KHP3R9]|jgi:alpha-L-rhamnosidase|nr:Alpha-L-rhamnosidase N-terminal domain-containing protein [Porphyromonadaceae bacterium KHP3R9]
MMYRQVMKKLSIKGHRRVVGSFYLCLLTLLLGGCAVNNTKKQEPEQLMQKAVPVWAEGREKEMNLTLGFRGVIETTPQSQTVLQIAASTVYRVFLNGEFVGSGPARAGHGYYRVDRYDLSDRVRSGENIVAIEVAGYNINTFYTIDQPSFLQAEATVNGKVVLHTGDNDQFEATEIRERLQKVERYSYQRPFTEYYRLEEGYDRWRSDKGQALKKVKLTQQPKVNLLPRGVDHPTYTMLRPVKQYSKGTFTKQIPKSYRRDRSLVNISEKLKGYTVATLEVTPSQRIQELQTVTRERLNTPYTGSSPIVVGESEFSILDFGINQTGFIGAVVRCSEPTELWFHFDEMLTDDDVISKRRMSDVNNQVVYELQPGEYHIESFEPYTLKFLKIMVTKGACQVADIYLREFASPENPNATFTSSNEKLNRIYDAAKQTYRQNALDIFMDCPSRERAGWLCDSYFTAIMEKEFTGASKVAYNFYQNYALPEKFEFLPEGMLPMCYPADHYNGDFIPNWALWFIIQIDDYAQRGGDPKLVADLQERISDLLKYFERFENEDGLLEKLESWIFVEWSKANSLVQDVNYPTNMLYSSALESAARLYGREEWKRKSEHLRDQILKQSFNGEFFIDNAVRENGKLKVTDQITEVCQYYAFFFNVATPESHPALWKKLTEEFGPNRDTETTYPHVAIANAFIGNYLRVDILSRYGLQEQLISEIEEYFFYMAERTGTLWENVHSQASCNHGFASYIAHVLYRDVLGISNIDYLDNKVTIRFTDLDLDHCSGSIPVGSEVIRLEWRKAGEQILYRLQVPSGYEVTVENRSKYRLIDLESKEYKQTRLYPTELTTEYLTNPTGLDVRDPRFSWKLTTTDRQAFGQLQTAYRILVSTSKEDLDKERGNVWDTGWISSDKMQLVSYQGKPLQSDQTYFWKVAVKDEKGIPSTFSETASFTTGLFSETEWRAKWIGTREIYDPAAGPNKIYDPWFRKSVNLTGKPAKATLFVASVGYHEVYVNGLKIGDHVLAPAVTDHTQRARYIAYDIAPALEEGTNVIAIWLGTSWSIFAPYATPDKPRTPIVTAQGDIFGKRGEKLASIITDESWKTHPSPNKLIGNWGFGVGGYGGEIWDANKEIEEWNLASYNDQSWSNATVYNPALKISAQRVEPNRLSAEIKPVAIESRPDGTYRIDMGVNFAGWTEIAVEGKPGDTISFQFSERQQDDMTFGLHNLYVVGPSGKGTFRNRFNYSSGRWITVKGLTSAPAMEDIKGWMVRTDYADATSFTCSDPLQNWIYNTVNWTFENLSLGGYIVDCPQRERFGYGGDAHATSETGMLNYSLGAFYNKWLEDWRDVQGTEPMVGNMNDPSWARRQEGSGRKLGGGILPQTAPTYHGGGGPAWGGIVVTLPWFMYQYQGDLRVLEENFEMIKGWLAFLDTHVENNLLKRYGGQWDFLGDWLWPGATAQGMNNYSDENLFFNNCYWIYNLKTAAKVAETIGRRAEAGKWKRQAEISSQALHDKYYHADDHNYSDRTMRSLSAALYGDIMPQEIRPLVMQRLEREILLNRNGHIDVGITAGAMLFKVLREEGRDDLIYAMTSQTTYPSWGFMRENGATTIWEMWEKDLPGHSLLHSSYLYPGAWYIDGVGGIRRRDDSPGFRKVDIRVPKLPEEKLSWAKTRFNSPAGTIESYWKRENGKTMLVVTVPPNCSATVYFPDETGRSIRENSGLAKVAGKKNGYRLFEISSGNYIFEN